MTQQQYIDFLQNLPPERQSGDRDEFKTWWVEHQDALEAAGYMLQSRNHRRTNKLYLDADDGPIVSARVFYAFLVSAPTNFLRGA